MIQNQYFLIQCSGEIASHKYSGKLCDRTYAEEMNKFNYYRNDTWNREDKRDRDFGEVKIGDITIQYCTSNVKESPSQIKNIFSVEEINNIPQDPEFSHVLKLKLQKELIHVCHYSTIQKLAANGVLSEKMKKCGQRGFNICKVTEEDYQKLLALNFL
jgi:hypothetical protein